MFILESNEEVKKVVRRHFLVMLPTVLMILVLAFLPCAMYLFFGSEFLSLNPSVVGAVSGFVSEWGSFAYAIWLLILWIFFFVEWTDYYLDLWIITNKRIIDVEQNGFFHREVTSFSFDQIQDITVETRGFIETMLKFGTLHIQTAGHNRNIVIKDAHYPEDARSLILDLQQRSKQVR